MPSVMPSPRFQWVESNGNPLVGGKLYTYVAGTSSPLNTYTDASLATPNANPVILDASGSAAVYLSGSYKLVLKTSADVTVWTQDNVNEIPSVGTPPEWVPAGVAPTFVSGTNFTVPGDYTVTLHVGRRVKATVTAGTRYGTITSTSYGGGNTTVVLIMDSGSLDAGLSAIYYGIVSADPTSMPRRSTYNPAWIAHRNGSNQGSIASAAYTKIQFNTEELDQTGIYDNATNYRATIVEPGLYIVGVLASLTTITDGKGVLAAIFKNGSAYANSGIGASGAATGVYATVAHVMSLAAGDQIEAYVFNSDTISQTLNGAIASSRFWGVKIA